MELPTNLTVQKILNRIYEYRPASAGNIPIPATLPVRPFLADIVFAYVRAPPYTYDDLTSLQCIFFVVDEKIYDTAIEKDRRGIFSSTPIFLFV